MDETNHPPADPATPPDGTEPAEPSPGVPGRIRRVLGGIGAHLKIGLRRCIGQVHWQPPAWPHVTLAYMRRHPRRVVGSLLSVALLGAAAGWGYHWYQNRPKPVEPPRVAVQLTVPAATDYTQTPMVIHPLSLDFSASVAPIALVGKPVHAGITLEPRMAGSWRWATDRQLVFTPAVDWPVGQPYTLTLDPHTAVTPGTRLAETQLTFDTAPFAMTLTDQSFYQDPQDPLKKSALFGVQFTYPVDPASFERAVKLTMLDAKGNPGRPESFTITYDLRHLNAYVHSGPLGVPLDEQRLRATIAKGVKSSRGGPGAQTPLSGMALIPGLYSLALSDVSIQLVDNAEHEPVQTLIVSTSAPVTAKELMGRVHAWLLPKRHDHHDWYTGIVSQQVLAKAEPLPLTMQPSERDADEVHGLTFSAEPGRLIYVQIDKGLSSFGGYLLGKSQGSVLSVPDYPQMLKFLGQGSLLSMTGDHRLSVVARNVPGMRVGIAQILPHQIQHLVAFNQGDFSHPLLSIGPDHITTRFVETQPLPDQDPTKAVYAGVDLSRFLGTGKAGEATARRGVFLVRLSPWDPRSSSDSGALGSDDESPFSAEQGGYNQGASQSDTQDARLIVVTDLGLLVKRSLDGSYDVFVQSIHTGRPVDHAVVKVIAENGQTLLAETTGADGHVHFASLKGFQRELKPVMFTVTHADTPVHTPAEVTPGNASSPAGTDATDTDFSFLPIGATDRQLNYSRFDIGGAPNAQSAGELSAYLFSDRGLYRPGDEFHIGMILRAADWKQDIAGVPLMVELVDPRGMTVTKQRLSPDRSGFMEWQYTPDETAPTGSWSVNLYLIKNDRVHTLLGSTSVMVREFEPDQTRVTTRLDPDGGAGWIKPTDLHALIQADTLYGTPAANRRVTATLTLRPAFPSFPTFADYDFYDPHRAKEGYSEPLQTQQTDAKGVANFPIDLSSFANATYELRFYAQVFEPNSGRNVASAVRALVSSADYLIGIKPDGPMDFIPRDTPRKVNVLAIDPEVASCAVGGLKAVILARRYVSVLTRQPSGLYQYTSKLKETPIDSRPLDVAVGGTDVDLPTTTPGSYALVIESSNGATLNRIDFDVAGNANVSRSLERNAELQLSLNKKDYAPGETIDVAVRAPYAGNGLITIERDNVVAWTWFHSDTASSVQHITVPKDFEGNGYINVQFVRDPASRAIYMSPLSYGVVPFSVDLASHRATIGLDVPKLIKPGQDLDITVHTDKPTQVAVFAVDQGILQVAGYELKDPLSYFFRKRMLQVSTGQILDLILPSFDQFTKMASPGGDEDSLRKQQLNPFRRKHEKPVAYWSGITTVSSTHVFHYPVPDRFNGALKVMAVAVTPEQIGIAQQDTTVRGDFVLAPNLPTAVAPGDEFVASVNVANNIALAKGAENPPVPVAVQLEASSAFDVLTPGRQTISLASGQSGVVTFRLRARADLGSVPLGFFAQYQDKQARRSMDISVRPAVPFQTQLAVGAVKPGGQVETPDLRDLFAARAQREAAISYLPLVLMRGLGTYLANYTNYCTEQTISAATPSLIVAGQPEFARHPADVRHAEPAVLRALATLRSRQNAEGGFGVWSATPISDPFVSVYAMQYLLLARQAGIPVSADMIDRGLNYLRHLAADEALGSLPELRERAFAIALLTESGMVTTNLIALVQQRLENQFPSVWHQDLAAVYLATSYHLLKQDEAANRLINAPLKELTKPRPASLPWSYADYYDPLIFDATTLYYIERYFPDRARTLPADTLLNIVLPIHQGRYNTLSSAMTMLALSGLPREQADPATLSMVEGTEPGAMSPFGQVDGVLLAGALSPGSSMMRFVNHGTRPAWYSLTQAGYDRVPPTSTIKDGLEIVREYTDDAGKPVTTVHLGQTVNVHLSLRALGDRAVGDVAIVDILPGGFEIVHPAASGPDPDSPAGTADAEAPPESVAGGIALAQPGSDLQTSYVEPREDRVLIYATANRDVQQFVYRIRATNEGRFIEPPAYAESMYDRALRAYTPGTGTLTIEPPAPEQPMSASDQATSPDRP